MPHSLCIVIAGSGIGGLAAAYALARVGHAVTVLEQAPVFGEIGAGIRLGPVCATRCSGAALSPLTLPA